MSDLGNLRVLNILRSWEVEKIVCELCGENTRPMYLNQFRWEICQARTSQNSLGICVCGKDSWVSSCCFVYTKRTAALAAAYTNDGIID